VKENVRNYGEIVMTSKLNVFQKNNAIREYVTDLYWEYDRMSSSGQSTLDSLAKLYGVETNQQLEQRLSKMSKEEIKQELERS
jgi:viroplasmin and RNaseH domain-containing protein